MARDFDVDRRSYLATVGVAGVAGLAGCPVDGGNGNGDDTDTDDGTGTPDDGGPTGDDVIRLATAGDFPPFATLEEGVLVGVDVDLAETVVERADYEIGTWTDIRFEALVQELNADQFDMVAAAMSTELGREEEVAFSAPYYDTDQAVLVRAGGAQPQDESDLEGGFIGAQAGTTSEAEVERLVDEEVLTEDDYRSFGDFTNTVEALTDETLDAVVADLTVGEVVTEGSDLEVAFVIETGEEYALAMRTDDGRLEDVEPALSEIMDDGTFEEIVAEHVDADSA